jgi:hypothetical protein
MKVDIGRSDANHVSKATRRQTRQPPSAYDPPHSRWVHAGPMRQPGPPSGTLSSSAHFRKRICGTRSRCRSETAFLRPTFNVSTDIGAFTHVRTGSHPRTKDFDLQVSRSEPTMVNHISESLSSWGRRRKNLHTPHTIPQGLEEPFPHHGRNNHPLALVIIAVRYAGTFAVVLQTSC